MYINNKYKRNIETLLQQVSKMDGDLFVSSKENISDEILKKIGFKIPVENGECIVPIECGRFSNFNLNGKKLIRRDLPKENRLVTTFCWSWRLWNGEEQEDYVDIYKDCYPRDYIPAPLEEIYFLQSKKCIVSRKIAKTDNVALLHIINMFLELFGECFLTNNLENIIPLKRVPWVIFPKGKRDDYSTLTGKDLCPNYERFNKRTQHFIDDRTEFLKSYFPKTIYKGESYFRNYFVFEYPHKGLTVLESNSLDNATYIFDKDWKEYSKLTKGDVIMGKFHKARIIHNKSWFENMRELLNKPK